MKHILLLILFTLFSFQLVASDTGIDFSKKETIPQKESLQVSTRTIVKEPNNVIEIELLKVRNQLLDDHNKQLMNVLWYALALIAAFLGAGFLFYRSQVQSERKEIKIAIDKEFRNLRDKNDTEYNNHTDKLSKLFDDKIEESFKTLTSELEEKFDKIVKDQAVIKKIAEAIRWDARREIKYSEARIYNFSLDKYDFALNAYLWVLRYDIKLGKHNSPEYLNEELVRSTIESIINLLDNKLKIEKVDPSTLTDLQNTINDLPANYDYLKAQVIKKLS